MKISRRDFFAHTAEILFATAPFFSVNIDSLTMPKQLFGNLNTQGKVLVFIHLAGGNDWFNTIIPFENPHYQKLRPNLALGCANVLKLNNELAFHPSLNFLKTQYDKKRLAILLNCDSHKHDLSHHKAIEQISYLDNLLVPGQTWQKSYANLIEQPDKKIVFPVVNLEPLFYEGENVVENLKPVAKMVKSSLSESNSFELNLDIHYKNNRDVSGQFICLEDGVISAMKEIALAIQNKSNSAVYHISLGGFDTHENQLLKHSHLLAVLDKGIAAFQSELVKPKLSDKAMIVVTSEFGRSLAENEYLGTEHGYINHAILIGNAIDGGIYGQLDPSNIENRAGTVSNESVLPSLLDSWLNCPSEAMFTRRPTYLKVVGV